MFIYLHVFYCLMRIPRNHMKLRNVLSCSSNRDDWWLSDGGGGGGGMFKRKINFTFSVCNCLHFYFTIFIGAVQWIRWWSVCKQCMDAVDLCTTAAVTAGQLLLTRFSVSVHLQIGKNKFEKERNNDGLEVTRKANAECQALFVHNEKESIVHDFDFGYGLRPYWTIDVTCIFMGIPWADSSSLLCHIWTRSALTIHHFSIRLPFSMSIGHDFRRNWISTFFSFFYFLHCQHVRGRETAGEMLPALCNHNVCVNNYIGITLFRFMLAGNIWRPFELCHRNE